MLLLTGATGLVGTYLLRSLVSGSVDVRCFVRDPRRLGSTRVRVQLAMGDLADPESFRNALRGVKTVVHLAASTRDEPTGSIEELNAIATWRLVQQAKKAGVEHFVLFSTLGASPFGAGRFFRAKALAEAAVQESGIPYTILAPSLIYAPGDRWLNLLGKLSLLPMMPIPGAGRAQFQPLWAEDVARAVRVVLEQDPVNRRYELAGPQIFTHAELVEVILGSFGRRRRLLKVPLPVVKGAVRALGALKGADVFATRDELDLLATSLVAEHAMRDIEALGVKPRRVHDVLGLQGA